MRLNEPSNESFSVLASSVPIKIINTLTMGFPTRLPLSRTPPEIVNNANNRIINGTYSKRPT